MGLYQEYKEALLSAFKEEWRKKYLLKSSEVKSLFGFVSEQLSIFGCDHTLRHTEAWLRKNFENENFRQQVLNEIEEQGGYCDCEVLLNCYEYYDLDF